MNHEEYKANGDAIRVLIRAVAPLNPSGATYAVLIAAVHQAIDMTSVHADGSVHHDDVLVILQRALSGQLPAEFTGSTAPPGGPFPRTVTCVWCGNRYVSAIPADLDKGTCGCNCACDVRFRDGHWDIFCGYGSENDMEILRFVANLPSVAADPVCDECIRERMLCGDIVRLDEALDPSKTRGLTELAQPTKTGLCNRPPREAASTVETVGTVGTVAALAAGIVAAGGTLPYPGAIADISVTPTDPLLNPQPHDRDLILEVIHDLNCRAIEQSAALRRLLERADDFLGWHVRDARVGRPE